MRKKIVESDRMFIKNLHDKFYAKKKKREMRKEEVKKQLWLFDDMKRDAI